MAIQPWVLFFLCGGRRAACFWPKCDPPHVPVFSKSVHGQKTALAASDGLVHRELFTQPIGRTLAWLPDYPDVPKSRGAGLPTQSVEM